MSAKQEQALPEAQSPEATPADTSLQDVAAGAAELLRAWWALLDQELALAKHSLRLWLVCAVAVPVVALSAWLGVSALLVAVAHSFTDNWVVALTLGAAIQVITFAVLLGQMRRWWRDLSLPQSRAALGRAMERMS